MDQLDGTNLEIWTTTNFQHAVYPYPVLEESKSPPTFKICNQMHPNCQMHIQLTNTCLIQIFQAEQTPENWLKVIPILMTQNLEILIYGTTM